jgi:hypothetical protein
MTAREIFEYYASKTYLPFAIGFAVFGIIINFIFSSIIMWCNVGILFASFDVLGFYFLYRTGASNDSIVDGIRIGTYRIIQTMFQVILTIALLQQSWQDAVIFTLAWLLGIWDYTFYLILKQRPDYVNNTNMYWLWWTIPGWFIKNITWKIFETVVIFGFVICYILSLILKV